jgi:hypothetical protein
MWRPHHLEGAARRAIRTSNRCVLPPRFPCGIACIACCLPLGFRHHSDQAFTIQERPSLRIFSQRVVREMPSKLAALAISHRSGAWLPRYADVPLVRAPRQGWQHALRADRAEPVRGRSPRPKAAARRSTGQARTGRWVGQEGRPRYCSGDYGVISFAPVCEVAAQATRKAGHNRGSE